MANRVEKRLLWHPRQENKFLIGGGSQISLYEWLPDVPEFRLVSSQADLQLMKCFAWCPSTMVNELVAVGSSAGKVDLWRMETNRCARNNLVSSGPELSLPIRPTRSALSLAFSLENPNLLAVGLDKIKGEPSLVVWDITVAAATAAKVSNSRNATSSKNERSIVQQYASAEVVSSLTFLPESTSLLVAGVSNLWLRLFDLRKDRLHVDQVQAAKVNGIVTDHFDKNRIACFGEGSVTVWDTRRFTSPLLTFTLKDAVGDGARTSSLDPFVNASFSPVRRGLLATLTRDSTNVRFWDIQQTPSSDNVHGSEESLGRTLRDAPRSSKLSRLSWAAPSTILPWSASSEQSRISATAEPVANISNVVLSNTKRTKTFSRPIVSFSLAPSPYSHPLTSNVVVVSREGDIEMHEMHDVPKHTVWSSRGELALGVGTHFRVFPGYHEDRPPPEPWELGTDVDAGIERNDNNRAVRDDTSRPQSRAAEADRQHLRPGRRDDSRLSGHGSPAITFKSLNGRNRGMTSEPTRFVQVDEPQTHRTHSSSRGRKRFVEGVPPSVIESDISMTMRSRVLVGYALFNTTQNAKLVSGDMGSDNMLSEVWRWLNHSKHILASGPSKIHGIDFSFQGILGIWQGIEPSSSQDVVSLLDGLDLASPSEASSATLAGFGPSTDVNTSSRSRLSSRHGHRIGDSFHGNYSAALNMLNSRINLDKIMWKPAIHTDKSQQRRLALALCDWKVGEEEFLRWEKEGKCSQAACWLLFTNQGARAIDVLMRSKNETHQMLSGTIAALLQTGVSSRNHDLKGHCEKLIVRLQDPHQRIMLSYIVFNDWHDVLEEEALPLRERLAIALRFLDDKELTSYLRRIAEDCRSKGIIEGLIVTGLTPLGLDILQNYLDSTGDIQTAAVFASYVCPGRYKDARAERWVEAYRELLDGWRLFHHRCQFDIDRGKILQEGILNGDFTPMEWVKKQFLIRCNFCNKVVNAQQQQRPQEPITMQKRRAATCPWCGRSLPRCSVCLMSICVVPDSGRETDLLHSSFRDAIDDAYVFCQKCRHGGHASHMSSWFSGADGSRRYRTCPVADCDCCCDEEDPY